MKRIAILLFTVLIFSSCQDETLEINKENIKGHWVFVSSDCLDIPHHGHNIRIDEDRWNQTHYEMIPPTIYRKHDQAPIYTIIEVTKDRIVFDGHNHGCPHEYRKEM